MSVETLDDLGRQILDVVQKEIPMVAEPFKAIAEQVGTDEETVMERLRSMKGKEIRQISAIFDTRALGYSSSLVAAKVKPEHLDQAAQVINQHPGVSHNYKRNHDFNLWFTIAVPPNSRFGLEKTVELLGKLAEVDSIRILPTLKLYKIGVQLNVKGEETTAKAKPEYTEEQRKKALNNEPLTEMEIKAIRELQKDLEIVSRPFDQWAENIGITTAELIEYANRFIERKQMRRFSAVLNHRKAGFTANGMGVWAVPPEKTEEIGPKMAAYKAVSHCYLRPTYEDWPYSIFTMVHGRSVEEVEDVIRAMEEETGIHQYAVLYSTKEYKKTRVQYFTPEMEAWEKEIAEKYGL
jgi:DNA-binding Lrp family transcriptional regulator